MNIINKIILVAKLNSIKNKFMKEAKMVKTKSGIFCTEFWLVVASAIVSIWFAVSGMIPADLSLKIVAGVGMVYTIARAIVKVTSSTKDDEILDKLEKIVNKK